VETELTDCDSDVVEDEMSASQFCVTNAALPTVTTGSDDEQSSQTCTIAVPPVNTAVPDVTATVPCVSTTVPQVTCHSVQSLHAANETFPPSLPSSVSSTKKSASSVHGIICICVLTDNSGEYQGKQ